MTCLLLCVLTFLLCFPFCTQALHLTVVVSTPASPSKKSASAVTAAMSPTSPVHFLNLLPNAPTSNDSKALNFLPDLSGMPTLPGSPSAAAYKMRMANFSRIMAANRHGARKNHRTPEEGRDEVVRRMSVRHSENAFKYKEIVVKKEVGYTQVALFTQTKLKNALNPKVSRARNLSIVSVRTSLL